MYDTLGTVVMTSILNSRSSRSCTISMCRSPRKPQRKPNPRAIDDSGWNVSEASLSCSFSSEARRFSYSDGSIGYTPANTIGFTSWKPDMALSHGRATCVMVSPTFTSLLSLMPLMIYPTLPVDSSFLGSMSIFSTPTSSATYSMPVLKNFTLSPCRMVPFSILKYAMMPLKELNTESKMRACSGLSLSPSGCGIRLTTALSISSTPSPVFPLALIISLRSHPMRSMISSSTSSGMALGMSILFMTGIISRLWSIAM